MSNSLQQYVAGFIEKDSRRLSTLDEWFRYAPPKNENHWKDGRSTKENARLWLNAAPALPSEISSALDSCTDVGRLHAWYAEPEAKVSFDEFDGESANVDLLLVGEDERGPIVVAIEAKADEPFGATVEKTLSKASVRLESNPRSKGIERIQALATLFELDLRLPDILDLRYQLMTITAAALAEAERRSTQRAVIMVHEFVTCQTEAKKRTRNAHDVNHFLKTVFGQRNSLRPGAIVGPFEVKGMPKLYFGKAQTFA